MTRMIPTKEAHMYVPDDIKKIFYSSNEISLKDNEIKKK